jgi:hypothetical protein
VCAVPSTAVFCRSLTSCFPGTLLKYFLKDFEIVPVAPIITGVTFVFTFHVRCISVIRYYYYYYYYYYYCIIVILSHLSYILTYIRITVFRDSDVVGKRSAF